MKADKYEKIHIFLLLRKNTTVITTGKKSDRRSWNCRQNLTNIWSAAECIIRVHINHSLRVTIHPQLSLDYIAEFIYNIVIKHKGSMNMPTIKSSAELRNDYNGISTLCHTYREPVFITKNGKGDLAVMSIETYEQMTARFELYSSLEHGMQDVSDGRTRPLSDAMADLKSRRRR